VPTPKGNGRDVMYVCITGVNTVNPVVVFYDILGRKGRKGRGAFLLFFPGHHMGRNII
jgi:hypothetical protein